MPPPPPRKRFQVHLSTAIVLMFVAGAVVWMNVRPQTWYVFTKAPLYDYWYYGWPDMMGLYPGFKLLYKIDHKFNYQSLIIDLIIALNILYLTYRLCEWWIARRASRNDDARLPPSTPL